MLREMMMSKDPPPIPNELPLLKNIQIETNNFSGARLLTFDLV